MGAWGYGPTDNDSALDILQPMQKRFLKRANSLLGHYVNEKARRRIDLVNEGLAYAVAAIGIPTPLDEDEGKILVGLIRKVARTDEGYVSLAKRRGALKRLAKQVAKRIEEWGKR